MTFWKFHKANEATEVTAANDDNALTQEEYDIKCKKRGPN